MTDNSVLAPEMDLIRTDEFYLFYEMMIQSLKTDNVKEGINKSLFLLKKYLQSGNIALFKKTNGNRYTFKISDSNMDDLVNPVGSIVNKTSCLTENKEIFFLDLNLSDRIKNLMLIHLNTDEYDCIVAILNNNLNKQLGIHFWESARDTLQIILKRAASYEKNVKAITTDLLTGVDNRNSYEMRLQEINESDNNLVLGIFDIFRLKYINDNFTHPKGDLYIKKVASILNKYWPKQKQVGEDELKEKIIDTGHCIYRVGGDEFVLITSVEDIKLTSLKAQLSHKEAELIDLQLEDVIKSKEDAQIAKKVLVGLNYGVVRHNPGDKIKDTIKKADYIMQEDKRKMYIKHNLERRD